MTVDFVASTIRTERLVLRAFGPGDLETLYRIYSRPDVVRHLYEGPRSREEVGALLELKSSRLAIRGDGDTVSYAIALQATGEMIGDCIVRLLSAVHRQGEIGFVLHPDHHGRGYATEAARAMLGVGFDELGLHRLIGRLEARNAASARVLERLGMRPEAHLVENEWVKEEWQSEYVFAILHSEWGLRQLAEPGSAA
jgi:RimJ/RimL family protein N-acetyltransferase